MTSVDAPMMSLFRCVRPGRRATEQKRSTTSKRLLQINLL
jgi:hypothetical protein